MILLSGTALLIVLFVVCNLTNFGIIIIACLAHTSQGTHSLTHIYIHAQQEQYHLGSSWACLLATYHSPSRQSSDPTGASNFSREATLVPQLIPSAFSPLLPPRSHLTSDLEQLKRRWPNICWEGGLGGWKSVRRVFFGVWWSFVRARCICK